MDAASIPTPPSANTVRRAAGSRRGARVLHAVRLLAAESWLYVRWVAFFTIGRTVRLLTRNRRSGQRAVIAFGNRLFRRQYGDAIYASYEGYVAGIASSLTPYTRLAANDQWLVGRRVLDLGSGLGQYSQLLLQEGAREVVGLEYQADKSAWSASRFGNPNERFQTVVGSADALPMEAASFETIFSHTVFEHLPDVPAALQEAHRVLRPGGTFLLSYNFLHHRGGHHLFPYIHFPWPLAVVDERILCEYWSERLAADQAEGKMGFYPPGCQVTSLSEGNEIHLNRIGFEAFERMLTEAGFLIVARKSSEPLGRLLPFLCRVPIIKDAMTGTVFYVLRSSGSQATAHEARHAA